MNENSTDTELLIRYMDGELQGEDLSQLENRLKAERSLQEELLTLELARDSIRHFGLKNRVNDIHRQIIPQLRQNRPPGLVRRLVRNSLKIAAAVVFILIVAGIYSNINLSSEQLFKSHYTGYNIRSSRGTDTNSALEDNYKRNRMAEVITTFKTIKNPSAFEYFLTGNAFLQTDQPGEASKYFMNALQKRENDSLQNIHEDAEYYLAMSYLKNNEVDKALPIFEKIHSENNHPYHNKVDYWFLKQLYWRKK